MEDMLSSEQIEQRRDCLHELSLAGSENRRLDDLLCDMALLVLPQEGTKPVAHEGCNYLSRIGQVCDKCFKLVTPAVAPAVSRHKALRPCLGNTIDLPKGNVCGECINCQINVAVVAIVSDMQYVYVVPKDKLNPLRFIVATMLDPMTGAEYHKQQQEQALAILDEIYGRAPEKT